MNCGLNVDSLTVEQLKNVARNVAALSYVQFLSITGETLGIIATTANINAVSSARTELKNRNNYEPTISEVISALKEKDYYAVNVDANVVHCMRA